MITDAPTSEVLDLFGQAMELPVSERDRFVRQVIAARPGLGAELHELLGASGRMGDFLAEPAAMYAAPMVAAEESTPAPFPVVLLEKLGNRYAVSRELGEGGMASVYRARDLTMNRDVAIKVLRRQVADAIGTGRFQREIEITAALEHPHVVPVFDCGEGGGLLYYIMKYVGGGTLRDRLNREGPLPSPVAVAIALDIARALQHAHDRHVVHRDVKPENILLDGEHALVADFGVARLAEAAGRERLTRTGIVVGTPQYMSPEQAGNSPTIDGRSDQYSLACVLYEMLAGEPPFTGPTHRDILAKHLSATIPDLRVVRSTVPDHVRRAIERALQKSPADRFESMAAFARALVSPSVVQRTGLTAHIRGVRRYAAFAGAATILITTTAWLVSLVGRNTSTASVTDASRRIAVLYFDDLTARKELSHVSAGLTEDLIDELSQVRTLRVISPNGVRMLRDSAVAPDSLARRLDIGTLITGSIISSGSLLRLTVRLVDPRDGRQLHSRTIERPAWDVLTLQDSLTTEVALWLRERLGSSIRPREQRLRTRSAEAWELVQRGEALLEEGGALVRLGDSRAREVLLHADTAFALAERLDGRWVTPVVNRARTAIARAFAERDMRLPPESDTAFIGGLRAAIAHADRAVARSASAPEALAVRGEARLRLGTLGLPEQEAAFLTLAEADLRQAASARPDHAHAWSMLGDVYYNQARFADAAAAFQTAYESDAFLTGIRAVVSSLFVATLYAERFDESRTWCSLGRRRYPEDPRFTGCELMLLGATGRHREDVTSAWRMIDQIERADTVGIHASAWSFRRMMVAAVLARAGLGDSARAVIAATHAQRDKRPDAKPAEAYALLLLGDRDGALDLLRGMIRDDRMDRGWISRMPWYRSLHDDPEFRSLVQESPVTRLPSGRG